MGQISLQVPLSGQPNSTEDPKVASDMTTIQTWANGNIDNTNLSATLAQAASVNLPGQKVKGAAVNAGTTTVTNVNYSVFDQVTGIVLATNGLIRIWYQAVWQQSVSAAARAAIFIGTAQLGGASPGSASVLPQEATVHPNETGVNKSLYTTAQGLRSTGPSGVAYNGDVTTGQLVGSLSTATDELGGGAVDVFAAAGTYTISVQFKASSGTVSASNRRLLVQAISFT